MTVYDFLKENKMLADSFDATEMEAVFEEDMRSKKTLSMIPSYQNAVPGELPKGKLLAIDAGGTNLRFAEFTDGAEGESKKMPMFGIKEEICADEFFDRMAAEISQFDAQKVGLCFSYPCEILPNKDGRILTFTKEVKISGAEGKVLGEEINKRLETPRQFSVLNDTVGAQLGVCADIGVILGTGFNICYTDHSLGTIVNTECGQYGQLPCGTFDDMLSEEMNSPRPCAEKQISGAYLGTLIRIVARAYFGREIPYFELSSVSEFLIGEGPLYRYFSDAEKRDFREIIRLLLDRAAARAAMMVKCLLKGQDHAVLALEGSTVYKLPGYFDAFRRKLDGIPGLTVEIADARGTILTGCVRSLMG